MYKRGNRTRSEAERRTHQGPWWENFKIEGGRTRQVRLCPDKSVSQTWVNALKNALIRGEAGEPPDPAKLKGIPERILKSLGLISKLAEKRKAAWAVHVSDYVAELKTSGRCKVYTENVRRCLEQVGKKCKWATLQSVEREGFVRYMRDRIAEGRAPRSVNNDLSIVNSFFSWAQKLDRLDRNPLAHVERIDETTDRRRKRRAFTEDECMRLLSVAGKRELCYRLALGTGLRRRELKLLEWRDVKIDGPERPHLQLRAEATKSKRADVIPLSPELAARMRQARPQNVFPRACVLKHVGTFCTLKADLERAGIEYRDAEGRIAGFHAFRVTYITSLHRAGLPTRVVMALARHTDPKLTLGTYTDLSMFDTYESVRKLPTYGDYEQPSPL